MGDFGSQIERIVEPELMLDSEQAEAYSNADFEAPHSAYPVLFRERFPDFPAEATVLDLGCGPCDVTVRFAQLSEGWQIDAVDGAAEMLKQAEARIVKLGVRDRVRTLCGMLPTPGGLREHYDIILSTNLLHHLHDPSVLWKSIRAHARPGTDIFVADLRRSQNKEAAQELVDTYAADEPDVLRTDFYNSLLAAFTPSEVEQQLSQANLTTLTVEPMDDRHLLIYGVV